MGTVGLSFGSPTSGAGFDVSSTVASIVSNLQKVETPWKNQLSALESQDTALSSLGTLFSSLSNDLSSLTDLTGILAEKTGSSSDTNVLTLTAANSSAVAGTHTVEVQSLATTSSGYLTEIANASDALSGSITLQVGAGSAQTIAVPTGTGSNNLAGLASAINASGVGVTASVLTDASGSRLSLVSGTSGAAGNIAVTANSITDTATSTALAYTSPVSGVNAQLTVDGVSLTSASNTVANLIPGVTFQLLAPSATESGGSLEPIQVVIGNDNTGVESTVNQFVSDYNALIGAINAQQGDTSSGTPEPLFGSPTLSLLQQQLLSGLNTANPSGYLTAVTDSLNPTLSGSITLKVGNSIPESFTVGNSDNTLAGLASAINAANMGVTASVVQNSDGTSNLTFLSQAAGSAGALSVTSSLAAASATPLTFSGTDATASTAATGTLSSIPSANDVLSGSLSIQVGSGIAQTVTLDSSDGTLAA